MAEWQKQQNLENLKILIKISSFSHHQYQYQFWEILERFHECIQLLTFSVFRADMLERFQSIEPTFLLIFPVVSKDWADSILAGKCIVLMDIALSFLGNEFYVKATPSNFANIQAIVSPNN